MSLKNIHSQDERFGYTQAFQPKCQFESGVPVLRTPLLLHYATDRDAGGKSSRYHLNLPSKKWIYPISIINVVVKIDSNKLFKPLIMVLLDTKIRVALWWLRKSISDLPLSNQNNTDFWI